MEQAKQTFANTTQSLRNAMNQNAQSKQVADYCGDAARAFRDSMPAVKNLDVGPRELLSINTVIFSFLAFVYLLVPGVITFIDHLSWWGPPELVSAVRSQGVLYFILALTSNTARIFKESAKVQSSVPRDILRCFFMFFAMNVVSTMLFGSTSPQMVKWLEFFLCAPLAYFHAVASELLGGPGGRKAQVSSPPPPAAPTDKTE